MEIKSSTPNPKAVVRLKSVNSGKAGRIWQAHGKRWVFAVNFFLLLLPLFSETLWFPASFGSMILKQDIQVEN